MATLKTPGLKFYAEQIDPIYPSTGLYPTMSTYGILDLEGGPQRNELYVVCKDGSIQSVHEPNRPIGWELIEEGYEWFYRVTQMNHPRKRCIVRYHSRVEDPPMGGGRIGSVVTIERPRNAEITEQKDQGSDVTSGLYRFIDVFRAAAERVDTTQLTGDLGKIASIDPLLAQCAAIVDDPTQTTAMAKFAEGEMSYAEMRSLCG
jgi:hypothetical protein